MVTNSLTLLPWKDGVHDHFISVGIASTNKRQRKGHSVIFELVQ